MLVPQAEDCKVSDIKDAQGLPDKGVEARDPAIDIYCPFRVEGVVNVVQKVALAPSWLERTCSVLHPSVALLAAVKLLYILGTEFWQVAFAQLLQSGWQLCCDVPPKAA